MSGNSKYYEISNLSLKIGNKICIKTTQRLLQSSGLLLSSQNLDHALGLYTFAVEEFGKAIILKELIDNKKTLKKVPKKVFGMGGKSKSHNIKIKKAEKILPKECLIFQIGESLNMPSGKDTVQSLGRIKKKIKITANTTGTFLIDVKLDFAVRMRCFYVDWDEKSEYWHKWKSNLQTNPELLKKAIVAFKKIISTQDVTYTVRKKQT